MPDRLLITSYAITTTHLQFFLGPYKKLAAYFFRKKPFLVQKHDLALALLCCREEIARARIG